MSQADEGRSSTSTIIWIIVGICAVLFVLLALICGGGIYLLVRQAPNFLQQQSALAAQAVQQAQVQQRPSPGLELHQTDYATDRGKFKTKLISKAPSPQTWNQESMLPGVELVRYPSAGRSLYAWASPSDETAQSKRPAVIFLHAGHAFDHTDWVMAAPYADAGFVLMTPLLRGENGQPGDFSVFYDEVDDVLAAAEFIAKRPDVDPKRIFLAGNEVGGALALLTAMTTDRFKAAAAIDAPSDPVAHVRRIFPAGIRFDENDVREFSLRSPIAYATSLKCKTRLYVNGSDPGNLAKTNELAERAKTKKLDVAVVVVPGNSVTAVPPAVQQSIEFFKK